MPIADTNPIGASVIVYREINGNLQILILHRAHHGPDYEGDWAWTPPSGARQPGEDVDLVARRELLEETGLRGAPEKTPCGNDRWYVYQLMYDGKAPIILDDEHDRYDWVNVEEAIHRCQPERVAAQIESFAKRRRKEGDNQAVEDNPA